MALELNVGRQDRNIRIAVGGLLAILGLWNASFLLTLIGVIVIATGLFGFCALYKFLGMNTASKVESTTATQDLGSRASQNFGEFKQEASEKYEDAKVKATEKYEDLKEDASELAETAQKKAEELKERAAGSYADLKEDASELAQTAQRKVEQVSDATKEAAQEAVDKVKKS